MADRRTEVVDIGSIPKASGVWQRCRGLIGADSERVSKGLALPHCQSVHTFGMRVSLDLVFVDRGRRVLRVCRDVPPGRLVWGGLRASTVLELAAGDARNLGLEPGCMVRWQDC